MPFFTYILECADKTLYVGSTNDMEKRLHAHNTLKSGAHYTKIRRPVVLRYSEKFATFKKACAREAELKRLSRQKKIALIFKNS
ncbi:MAG: GIY-YIG catalytic domain protein [Candidatus Giovannonibacteria bacterium GW2011_GWA2_44_13b]|uniref:GIY-YIG catalytic domain protein n=2 Tax=Candidatus Giovannoniibacteriota TaxID=1752738 RepID=A0A0G1JE64_9BACT|nr:MAG: GIY-YIG catalytic domain protein [Candidatus Giovannonibacteria bacterium GW2011_GWA2_44_13b]OGF83222.1 MAG: hypothetical protein A2924_02810 [Candidatus Giovannonibacteria bacterium RIFCSPLOWO2_01_FULL_44_16]